MCLLLAPLAHVHLLMTRPLTVKRDRLSVIASLRSPVIVRLAEGPLLNVVLQGVLSLCALCLRLAPGDLALMAGFELSFRYPLWSCRILQPFYAPFFPVLSTLVCYL